MRKKRITSIRFETDYSELVDIATNPLDWPVFTVDIKILQRIHEDFQNMTMCHIPQNRNCRTDALAKEARSKGYIFFHNNQTWTDGSDFRRVYLSEQHLI
ncbi:hypothetical protein N665_0851s0015 [Sinapis alba]|nr:hypothetical protein N665_0851s0015 [Sinapis alba]